MQLLLKDYSSSIGPTKDVRVQKTEPQPAQEPKKVLGKRKRKTERELKILRNELKKNMLWTRDSIKKMRQLHEADFSMSEQQIYKWWWDQTRKRSKRQEEDEEDSESEQLYAFQDEFGGYSSRLRFK